MDRFIAGCGYLGLRVARRWIARGDRVIALTRSSEKAAAFQREGIIPLIGDLMGAQPLAIPTEARTVLFAVGYDRQSGHSIGTVYVEGLRRLLAELPPSVERVIYISSTGVYGVGGGEWVDEQTPCQPLREGGKACLAAEQLLQASVWGPKSIILRLAGIYGPGRIPRAADLKTGKPIDAPAEGYLNLIHVDDGAEIVLRAETAAAPPALYLVADGQPALRRDYYAELARLLDAPPPQFVQPPENSPAAARAASDKRIRNDKLIRELAPAFRYPSYRAGLAQIVAEQFP